MNFKSTNIHKKKIEPLSAKLDQLQKTRIFLLEQLSILLLK